MDVRLEAPVPFLRFQSEKWIMYVGNVVFLQAIDFASRRYKTRVTVFTRKGADKLDLKTRRSLQFQIGVVQMANLEFSLEGRKVERD